MGMPDVRGDNDPDFDEACGSGECVVTEVRTTTKYHLTGNGIIDILEEVQQNATWTRRTGQLLSS